PSSRSPRAGLCATSPRTSRISSPSSAWPAASCWCPKAGRSFPSSPCSTISGWAPTSARIAATSPPISRTCTSSSRACASGGGSTAARPPGAGRRCPPPPPGPTARRPRCLPLDEPPLGLAPIVVSEIARIIRELAGRGLTIVLVEQNAAMALELADRAYLLESGHISLHGTAAELGRTDVVRKLYLGA